jgi:hypothetical protein
VDHRKTEQMINAPRYNQWVRDSWHPFWAANSARSYATIEEIFKTKNADVNVLPEKEEPVLLLGSGPSLDDWRPYIKEWKHDIMCSTSQLSWLESAGVNPRYIFLIDADPTMNHLLHNYKPAEGQPMPDLITHPCIQREAFAAWGRPDNIYFFRMLDPGDDFFVKFLPMMYQAVPIPPMPDMRGIRTYIMNSGNVMNTMLVFANQKKYNPVFLCGYDLGYPGNQYRFQDYTKESGVWQALPRMPVPSNRQFRESHNGVPTDELCLFYKYSTIIMYGMAVNTLLTCSRGIVDEMPYVSPEEVVKSQGLGFRVRTPLEAYKIAQEYLRWRRVLILKTGFSISAQNLTDMKLLEKIQRYAYWYWWRNKLDWEGQAKRAAAKQIKKNARMANRQARKKVHPYDMAPTEPMPAATLPAGNISAVTDSVTNDVRR